MIELRDNTYTETAQEEAQRLGISVRTVFRRRAAAKRLIDQCSAPSDHISTLQPEPSQSSTSDMAWKLLVESLRDTIKRQEQEMDRMSQSIARLEGTLSAPQQQPIREMPLPDISRPGGINLAPLAISFLVGVVVMWLLRM